MDGVGRAVVVGRMQSCAAGYIVVLKALVCWARGKGKIEFGHERAKEWERNRLPFSTGCDGGAGKRFVLQQR